MNDATRTADVFEILQMPDPNKRPKYQRLVEAMVDGIRRGVWRPGDRLPAEEELTMLTPFSLGTVQRALRDLSEQGLVIRQHGLGSFVADAPRELQDPWHCRFLGDDGKTVLPIRSQAVQRVALDGTGHWTPYLGLSANVMRIDRIIDVNNEFQVFSRFYADRLLLNQLWEKPMKKLAGANFKKLITDEIRLPVTNITHYVGMADFDAEACERTSVKHPYRGMYMQAVARAGRERCIYYQEFFVGPTLRAMEFPESTL